MARDRAENAVIPGRTVSGVACSSGTPEPRREQQAAGGAGKGRTRGGLQGSLWKVGRDGRLEEIRRVSFAT